MVKNLKYLNDLPPTEGNDPLNLTSDDSFLPLFLGET